MENKGLGGLEERVLRQNFCSACGACLSLCPYLRLYRGQIIKLHDCDLEKGRCFDYCPRTEVDFAGIHERIFRRDYEDITIGHTRKILMARASEAFLREMGQNGGVVSALTDLALREGTIHAAILTRYDTDLLPQGYIATKTEDVLTCAGSIYGTGHTLEALNRGPWQGDERIGVVGLPCQVLALARTRVSQLERRTPVDRVDLVIGLFCTWALDYKPFIAFLKERFGDRSISKLDITPPPERLLKVIVDGELNQVPLDEIRSFICPSCRVCIDMTSEFSDISVGTVEGVKGWNTVLVRSGKGEALIRRAEAEGVIETENLPEDMLSHLKVASLLKKRRALDALKALGELEDAYLMLPPKMIDRILSETEEVTP